MLCLHQLNLFTFAWNLDRTSWNPTKTPTNAQRSMRPSLNACNKSPRLRKYILNMHEHTCTKALQGHWKAIGDFEGQEHKADWSSVQFRCRNTNKVSVARMHACLNFFGNKPGGREKKDELVALFIAVTKADCEMNLFLVRAKPYPQIAFTCACKWLLLIYGCFAEVV